MIGMKRRRRRRLGLTPLIDVIFLLLLFFMLSSTFLRFADVEVAAARASSTPGAAPSVTTLVKLRGDGTLALAGRTLTLAALPEALDALKAANTSRLILTAERGASVQALVDVLAVLERGPVPIVLAGPPAGGAR